MTATYIRNYNMGGTVVILELKYRGPGPECCLMTKKQVASVICTHKLCKINMMKRHTIYTAKNSI